jgi:hypothetical protein
MTWMVRALEMLQGWYKGQESAVPALAVLRVRLGTRLQGHPILSQRLSGAQLMTQALEAQMTRLQTKVGLAPP